MTLDFPAETLADQLAGAMTAGATVILYLVGGQYFGGMVSVLDYAGVVTIIVPQRGAQPATRFTVRLDQLAAVQVYAERPEPSPVDTGKLASLREGH